MLMTRLKTPTRFAALLMGPALVTSCAQIPRSTVAEAQFPSLTCTELAQEIKAAEATRSAADEARGDAWHAVLPFVVAARYADARSAGSEAQRRLDLLSAQSTQRGCTS